VVPTRNHLAVGNTAMHSVCVAVELQVTVNYIKTPSVTQQCYYGKFISPVTMRINTYKSISFLKKSQSN